MCCLPYPFELIVDFRALNSTWLLGTSRFEISSIYCCWLVSHLRNSCHASCCMVDRLSYFGHSPYTLAQASYYQLMCCFSWVLLRHPSWSWFIWCSYLWDPLLLWRPNCHCSTSAVSSLTAFFWAVPLTQIAPAGAHSAHFIHFGYCSYQATLTRRWKSLANSSWSLFSCRYRQILRWFDEVGCGSRAIIWSWSAASKHCRGSSCGRRNRRTCSAQFASSDALTGWFSISPVRSSAAQNHVTVAQFEYYRCSVAPTWCPTSRCPCTLPVCLRFLS